jgi:hypothetical protein
MEDLKYILNCDEKRLNELKKELEDHGEKIEDIRREKDRIYFFINHALNLLEIEKKKEQEQHQEERQEERQERQQKRRLYIFGGFYFEPVNLYFPDHEEIIFLRDVINRPNFILAVEDYKKILSKYYGNLTNFNETEEHFELVFKAVNTQQIFKFIFLRQVETLRNILKINNGDAFITHYERSPILYDVLNMNIKNVYIPCNTKGEFMEDIEFKPIRDKFKLIRADCMGSRQDCPNCSGEDFAELWELFRGLSKETD